MSLGTCAGQIVGKRRLIQDFGGRNQKQSVYILFYWGFVGGRKQEHLAHIEGKTIFLSKNNKGTRRLRGIMLMFNISPEINYIPA